MTAGENAGLQKNLRQKGAAYEELAIAYLMKNGMQILEHNYRTRRGEIDVIGRDKGYLVFVEIKYRSSTKCGMAAEAVNIRKQRTICRTADDYRMKHQISEMTPVRYDVIAIQQEKILWYQNAFAHIYG